MSIYKDIRSKWIIFLGIMLLSTFSYSQNEDIVQGKVRIKLSEEAVPVVSSNLKTGLNSLGQVETGIQQIDAINKEYNAVNMKRLFPYAGKHEYKHIKHGLHLWYELDVDKSTNISDLVAKYKKAGAISYAEPVLSKVLIEDNFIKSDVASIKSMQTTDDPRLEEQWHYNNTGLEESYVEGADINLFEAWEYTKGSRDVIVAIVDGGIDVNHSDLKDNIWVNEAELNGTPGVDDDNNGYIDDINGYNFPAFTGNVTSHFHGTHVAGTVSAVNNNGIGVAGVAGGSGNGDGTRLMSCQVFTNESGSGYFALALVYGADNGAVISQNSWGYSRPGAYEQSVIDAINYFKQEAGNYPGSPMKGGVVIFSAGNDNADGEFFPGNYEGVVTVASIGPSNKRAHYSNYGDWVDITAPGGDGGFGLSGMVLSTLPDDSYGFIEGTSMACPHVSGVAALAIAMHGAETFTNDDLEARLLSGVDNIDAYIPGYIGKMGSGLINAAKVLTVNEAIAPNKVEDFSVLGASKDFAVLSWSVPLDNDDDTPNKYFLYWSEDDINTDSLSNLDFEIIKNLDKNVGDKISFELGGLKEYTEYNFVVVAADRWGNQSEVSEIISVSTNDGSEIGSDYANLNVNVDVRNSDIESDIFNVTNNKNGILKWKVEARDIRMTVAQNSVSYPSDSKTISTSSASPGMVNIEESTVETIANPELHSGPSKMQYWQLTYPAYLFGSLDSTYTNSMATKFVIEQEEGFNLTRLSVYLRGDAEDGPFILEIYKGSTISDENRIYFDDDHYQLVNNSEDRMSTRLVKLDENIFIEKGETIWVVVHSPSNNKFPFGVYPAIDQSYSDNCLWSTDMGETWVPLSQGLDSKDFVWALSLESENGPLYKYANIKNDNGEIYGIGQQEISYDIDGSKLVNGTYFSNMVFMSNDENNPISRVPLVVNISGHKPSLNSASIIDFGRVFEGLSKNINVSVANTGLGRFSTETAVSSDPQFKVVASSFSLNMPPLSENNIAIQYSPDGIGNDNAVITLTSKNGEVYSFNVFGIGAAPAKIEIPVSNFNIEDVKVNDEISQTFTINNIGEYPLQYGFPAFTNDLGHIKEVSFGRESLGYTFSSSPYPSDFVFNDISETGVDITAHFVQDSGSDLNYNLDLGFEFPYFGHNYNSLYVSKHGILCFDERKTFDNNIIFNSGSNTGYIAALHLKSPFLVKTGKISYKKELGHTIVQYTDLLDKNSISGALLTFQIIIFDNGNIRFVFDSMGNASESELKGYYSAVEDVNHRGVLDLRNQIMKFSTIDILSPGIGIIESISEPSGIIPAGTSKELVMNFDKTKLVEGTFTESISVYSNDPFSISKQLTVNVNVNSGGITNLVFDKSQLLLGDIINNSESYHYIEIKNDGNKVVEIVSATSNNSNVELVNTLPVVIKPGQIMYAKLKLNTDIVGVIDDSLVFTDIEGNNYTVSISANVVDAPQIVFSSTVFSDTLEVDQVVIKDLTIENKGQGSLEYAFVNSGLAYVDSNKEVATSSIPEFVYKTKDTYKNNDVSFRWYNVGEENKFPFIHSDHVLWSELELPFEFEFYQEKYTTLYVNMQGVVSFDEPARIDKFMFPDIPNIGEDDYINNYIAPYFAGQDLKSYDISGVYYKVFDDKLVIEWKNMADKFSKGAPYSFQLILHENGTIKFQYNTYFEGKKSATNFGFIGIESKDASEYLLLAGYDEFINPGVAVEIIPTYKEVLMAGESKSYDLILDAKNQFAGNIDQKIEVFSNDPQNQYTELNVNIEILGEPEIGFDIDTVDFGEVFISENVEEVIYPITVKNTGKKSLNIRDLKLEHKDDIRLEYLVPHPYFGASWKEISFAYNPNFTIDPDAVLEGKLRLVFKATDTKYYSTPYKNAVIFKTNYGTNVAKLDIVASYIEPPVFTIDKNEIYHSVITNDTIVDKLVLGNLEGNSVLEYSVVLDYNRVEAAVSSLKVNEASNAVLSSTQAGKTPIAVTNSVQEEFYKILSYEDNVQADSRLGFNGQFVFTAATSFVAPLEGFKLSHVQTYFVPGDILESDIIIEVRAGADINDSQVIHTQTVHHSVAEEDQTGSLLTFELDEKLSLLPYENFHVSFSYPIETTYPQGFAQITEETLTNTFFVYDEAYGKWVDLSITAFNEARYIIRAAQKEKEDLQWIVLSDTLGTIQQGNVKELEIKIYPEKVSAIDNAVTINVNTNDPFNSQEQVEVLLHLNQGPQLLFDDVYSVLEGETLEVDIPVVDVEGDDIVNVKLHEEYSNISLAYSDGKAKIIYAASYEDAGIKTFVIETIDSNDKVLLNQFQVEVYNVNRAPIASDSKSIILDTENPIFKADFYSLFEDPDGQEMTFTAEIIKTEVAEVFVSESGIIVTPIKTGFTKILLSATDSDGATTHTEKVIVVNAMLSNEDLLATKWEIKPNPVKDVLNIELQGLEDKNITVQILDMSGVVVKSFEEENYDRIIVKPISDLASGIYLIELSSKEGKSINKIVKQ